MISIDSPPAGGELCEAFLMHGTDCQKICSAEGFPDENSRREFFVKVIFLQFLFLHFAFLRIVCYTIFIRLSKTCQDRGNLFGSLYVKERGETVMKNIITISREFGSGGRSIGKQVAEKLGYAFYDRELVDEVAKRSGFAPEYIEEHGEYANARNSLLFYLATAERYSHDNLSMHDQLYITQSKIIEELAEKGKCVIVGRCADYILRDRKDCLHVFICSDMASRARRIVERYGQTQKAPEKRLAEKDQKRKVYYKNYTGRVWGQAQNYDICLNSGALGVDTCADMIVQLCK